MATPKVGKSCVNSKDLRQNNMLEHLMCGASERMEARRDGMGRTFAMEVANY